MKIYTKTGDDGSTGLFGAGRVRKDSIRVEVYGTVDELNAFVGVARTMDPESDIGELLGHIQPCLFVLGADLATPHTVRKNVRVPRILEEDVLHLEQAIDKFEAELPPLKKFILPAGVVLSAQLHVARTVCRRAERQLVTLADKEDIGPFDLKYLNRLSDLLFVLARVANHRANMGDVEWLQTHE